MSSITFSKAERRKAKLRMAIAGTSGSGKTYTSLLIGRGLAGDTGRIAVADTENRSAALYSHLTDFDTCVISAPYEVEKYISVIHAAEEAGYDVLIIDSATPVWKGTGGLLEKQEIEAETCRNKFSSWRNVARDYKEFVEAIVTSKIHVIVTLRSQTAWDTDSTNESGKKVPVKIGLKPEMRDGFDYEFTVVLNMNQTQMGHLATVSKDRTGLFDTKGPFIPGMDTGIVLRDWLESGTTTLESNPVPSFAPPAKKRPERIYSGFEFRSILENYAANGWDTSAIHAAKFDEDTYDRDAIDTDCKMWRQMTNALRETAEHPTSVVETKAEVTPAPVEEQKPNVTKIKSKTPKAEPASTPPTTPHPPKEQEIKPNSLPENPVEKAPKPPVAPTPAPVEEPAPVPEKTPEGAEEKAPATKPIAEYICANCGVTITKVQKDVSTLFMGRCLCKKCMGK